MNVKTMEGLAGAGVSVSLISTPMKAVQEAERKGDVDKMKRALGYAAGLKEQAEDYGEKASQGMKLDAREAKEQEKLRQEKLIETRREERKEQEKQIEESTGKAAGPDSDCAEISQEGKYQAQISGQASPAVTDGIEDVTYDKTGEAAEAPQEAGENVNVTA